jgi:hypothetical protein
MAIKPNVAFVHMNLECPVPSKHEKKKGSSYIEEPLSVEINGYGSRYIQKTSP